jgi:hypothetical protein
VQLFELVPQLQLQFEPELAELNRLLDDELSFQEVKDDLAHRFPKSRVTGCLSTPAEVILRMLIIKHLHCFPSIFPAFSWLRMYQQMERSTVHRAQIKSSIPAWSTRSKVNTPRKKTDGNSTRLNTKKVVPRWDI